LRCFRKRNFGLGGSLRMAMDAIHLMGVKPPELKRALGGDLVRVVRGSRKAYNAYQAKLRRGEIQESSESEDDKEPDAGQMWTCEERACGGRPAHAPTHHHQHQQHQQQQNLSTTQTQTDPIDLTHYFDTDEILKLNNLTILTCVPRDIQEGLMTHVPTNGTNLTIIHRGSSTSTASQINMERRAPNRAKLLKFFVNVWGFLKGLAAAGPLLPPEDWSDDDFSSGDSELDPEWMETPSPEGSRDDMQAGYELEQRQNPP
jgi:hypothetical protein